MILVGLAIDQIAQSGLSSLSVIYYSAQLFRKIINDWRQDYNECRPHSTLNYQTPSEFAAGWRKGHS
ncbi:integrase core domain-containing protein, partial [Citrobacter braakii]|uniref:integrase core domain-containing protein n=1 Tax=Citrobacter braakii TaxID=57706 RepID=UPI0039B3F8B3